MRSYSDVRKEFYAAFDDLAGQVEEFLADGESQAFHGWLRFVISRFGLRDVSLLRQGFTMAVHLDLPHSVDQAFEKKFNAFLSKLQMIDNLGKELAELQKEGVRPEVLEVKNRARVDVELAYGIE